MASGARPRGRDFAALRQFGRDEVLPNAGVPPLIAGYLPRPITYNASEQKQLYWESTISNFITEEQAVKVLRANEDINEIYDDQLLLVEAQIEAGKIHAEIGRAHV